ncbi:MAG: AI-2E family transporter [Caldiserica bacterium]|jgi:predicted PurR-regulated permease PerM|nr:AI-2E family transporter [Caldisericota bacterium]MDH7561945.1 AI-2E family transporter [Caldisericota bacterium]
MGIFARVKRNKELLWSIGLGLVLVVLLLVAFWLVYFLFKNLAGVLAIFIWAGFLGFLLYPLVNLLSRALPRTLSSLIVLCLFVFIIGLLLYLVVPAIVSELAVLRDNLPSIVSQLQQVMTDLDRFLKSLGLGVSLSVAIQQVTANLQSWIGAILGQVVAISVSFANFLVRACFVFLVTLFLLRDWPRLKALLFDFLNRWGKWESEELLNSLSRVIARYLTTLLLTASIVAVLTGTGLFLLGVSYSWILGIIAFFGEFVPYLGPLFSTICGIILSLGKPLSFLFYVLLIYLGVQALQNYAISPLIMSARMGFHPLLVIFAVLSGGALFGFWGIILSIPILSIIKTVVAFIGQSKKNSPPQGEPRKDEQRQPSS